MGCACGGFRAHARGNGARPPDGGPLPVPPRDDDAPVRACSREPEQRRAAPGLRRWRAPRRLRAGGVTPRCRSGDQPAWSHHRRDCTSTAPPACGRCSHPCPQRRPDDRFRQRHPGHPVRPYQGTETPPQQRHHQGQGGGFPRLRRLAAVSSVHRPAVRILDRPDLRSRLRHQQEERHRHPPRDRRDGTGLHPARDRHVHPAVGGQRLFDAGDQAEGVRQVCDRGGHPGIGERPADPELRRVLLVLRSRRPDQGSRRSVSPAGSVAAGAGRRRDDGEEPGRDAVGSAQAGHAAAGSEFRREERRLQPVQQVRARGQPSAPDQAHQAG